MLVTLDSITTKITKGTTPTSVGCTFENSGVNFIKSESLGNSRNIDRSKFAFISEQTHEKLKRSQIEKNDILFSMAGMFLGKTGIVTDDLVPANTNQAVAIIRIDTEKANHEYVYYYLNQRSVVQAVNASSAQSAQPNINLKQIGQIEIDLPERKLQDKIVSILSAIDFKIEKNNQINENLADLLQTIYQDRFGNDILAVNQGVLSDICSYSRDKVAVSELNVSTYFSTENMLSEKAGSTEATSLPTTSQTTACHKGDTLISNIRPYFKKIVYCEGNCGCSTDVLCFTPSQPRYSPYLFSTLYADKFFAFMVAGSKGTKMPRGDKQQIMTYPVVLPSEEELAGFNTIASPLLKQIYSNRAENKRLSILRDTLLPKLMSGEIDVSAVQL